MLLDPKRLAAVLGAAASLVAAVPSSSHAVIGPCQTRSVQNPGGWQDVFVTGESAPQGAIDVRLTCGVVWEGMTVYTVSDPLVGPVAAVAGGTGVDSGSVSPCWVLQVLYIDHTTYSDTCP